MKYDIIVVGAGASGLLASISAAKNGAKVLIVEKMRREGRKMLISGKGRCNITNTELRSEFFKKVHPNGKFLKHAFGEFFSEDIIKLLEENGLKTKIERGGRVFPESDNAADVVNTLLNIAEKNHVEIKKDCKILDLIIEEDTLKGIVIERDQTKEQIFANNVILCTGGKSYPATGSTGDCYKIAEKAGHTIIPTRPALVPIETSGNMAKELQGLSLKNVMASVWINGKKLKEEFGEMLFAHFGLTGPIILTLSRDIVDGIMAGHKVDLSIDFKPALDDQKLDARLQRELNENGKKQINTMMKSLVPLKLIHVILSKSEIDESKECHQISGKERKKLKSILKDLRFEVSGHRSFNEAIITAGGIDLNDVDSKTMMSKHVNNLYFAGELLDLDAETGGYNFQVAFSTGWLAGKSAAQISTKDEKIL